MQILVWDIWVDNKDGRQAVFFRAGGKFAAEMIDNGMAFGFDGAAWTMRDQPFGKAYPPLAGEYLLQGPMQSSRWQPRISSQFPSRRHSTRSST